MKISEVELGRGFRTKLTRRVGVLQNILGFKNRGPYLSEVREDPAEQPSEKTYVVRFGDGEVKTLHGGVEVDPL